MKVVLLKMALGQNFAKKTTSVNVCLAKKLLILPDLLQQYSGKNILPKLFWPIPDNWSPHPYTLLQYSVVS